MQNHLFYLERIQKALENYFNSNHVDVEYIKEIYHISQNLNIASLEEKTKIDSFIAFYMPVEAKVITSGNRKLFNKIKPYKLGSAGKINRIQDLPIRKGHQKILSLNLNHTSF